MKQAIMIGAVLISFACHGADTVGALANRNAAEELVGLINADKTVADVQAQIKTLVAAQIGSLDIPASMRAKSVEYQQQVIDLIFSEVNPAKLKPAYVDVYASTFTAEELAGLVAFYKTAAGRAYADKMSTLTTRMIDVSQSRVKLLEPQLQKMHEDFMSALRQSAAKQ